jgi:hypothetical protein
MKEQWTLDLQKKMSNYEVPTIPEGLWEDIDAAIGEITIRDIDELLTYYRTFSPS